MIGCFRYASEDSYGPIHFWGISQFASTYHDPWHYAISTKREISIKAEEYTFYYIYSSGSQINNVYNRVDVPMAGNIWVVGLHDCWHTRKFHRLELWDASSRFEGSEGIDRRFFVFNSPTLLTLLQESSGFWQEFIRNPNIITRKIILIIKITKIDIDTKSSGDW